MVETAIVWLRDDLRIADNPALNAAMETGDPVIALYIHETDPSLRPIGAAARWWLHHSLTALATGLAANGIPLDIVTGSSRQWVPQMVARHDAAAVFWNRRYSPAQRAVDGAIKSGLQANSIIVASFCASLLVEPFDIATQDGKPYAVFSPFWRALKQRQIALPAPAQTSRQKPLSAPAPVDADYRQPKWAGKLAAHWSIGEAAAQQALDSFLGERLASYKDGRDTPADDCTSRLSPHLRFGEIGPRQLWHAASMLAAVEPANSGAVDKFLSELAWREFSYHLLYHRDDVAMVPMQKKYIDLPWRPDQSGLAAWQSGLTGLPIIDAGMRQLWQTGWMHNRVRMLVASLLAKNLLIDWRLGEQWFWDTLVDADPASNPVSWQWVAGCGADAAPYFRIFNPVTQGEKFDTAGAYVRRWVPELKRLPDAWIHQPAAAPPNILAAAGVALGKTYPEPIVDLQTSRRRALDILAGAGK